MHTNILRTAMIFETEISLHEVTKSINSQTNNKSSWPSSKIINTSQLNYPLSFQMFMTPWKSLAPWVLLLVQESYLLYINSDYKNLGYIIYTTILKNHMQATLDAIIGENQSAAIKNNNITHIFHNSTCN